MMRGIRYHTRRLISAGISRAFLTNAALSRNIKLSQSTLKLNRGNLMPSERSPRSLFAVILFVLALFIAINYLVEQRPFGEWWLPVILFGAGALIAITERRREPPAVTTPGARAYTVREYSFATPASAPALV